MTSVHWESWGEEAFTRARREDKPIFLTIGYSTCSWCHVMERESFADPVIARRMNEGLVNIRVDREERPEIDEIYTAATRLLTHQAGWPNNLFLTPELEPYFAGTYFPPEDTPERPSFRTVVESMLHAWENRRDDVREQAADLLRAMRLYLEERGEPSEPPERQWSEDLARRTFDALAERFDGEHGFGPPPRFPMPHICWFLRAFVDRDARADEMLRKTLDAMARGGLYDQLGGGFHRYSLDAAWKVPTFEKLLCDNGLLLEVYAEELMRTGDPEIRRTVRETADFLIREMRAPEGAFYNAIDARSEGHEGAHYVWLLDEIVNVLGAEDAGFLAPILGFDQEPFFEEHFYVLHQPRSLAEQAERRRLSTEDLARQVAPLRARLFAAREQRPRPEVDRKILTDWNGMAIAGLATAGQALGEASLIRCASQAADFLFEAMRDRSGLRHVLVEGSARHGAGIHDYVHLVRGLLALHEATGERSHLDRAAALTEEQIEHLGDSRGGRLHGFFNASISPDLLCRGKEVADGGLPAANAVAVLNLAELARRRGEPSWRDAAEQTLGVFSRFSSDRYESSKVMCLAMIRIWV